MEIDLLGPLRVTGDDGAGVDVGSRKQRTLLALLALNANRVVTTDRIIDELWPGDPDGHENALWVYISRLRSALEPDHTGRTGHQVLRTTDHGYTLTLADAATDIARFEGLVHEAGTLSMTDAAGAVDRLQQATELWRGTPLDGLDAPFVAGEVSRLEELRAAALEQRFDLQIRLGGTPGLIAEIEVAHQQHPYRESFVSQLMLAMYRRGRQADALRSFQRFRRMMADDLGVDPSPELVRLEEQILLHDSRLRPTSEAQSQPRVPAALPAEAANPYKGLRAFGEDDAQDFFGRARLVADIVRRVDAGARLVALIGPSGSGKSSVLKAGVIPALRKGAVDGSDQWLVARMIPGARPFAELEAALLRSTLDAPESLREQLRGEDGVLGAALRLLPDERSKLVVVIDQLEELFTLSEDPEAASAFFDALLPALDDPRGRVVVLATLRADFYGAALGHAGFGTRLGDGVVNVVPLAVDELEQAATEPMRRVGCHFEPAALVSLLSDVAGQPGALPMFQYTLTELFERRTGDRLTAEAYRELGGVRGALATRAEAIFEELDDDAQSVAQQLFLRMVAIGDGDAWSRRRVAASEVLGLDVDVVTLESVIHHFGDQRLLSFDRDPTSGSPTVEVAHEALLHAWPRLEAWIDDARDDVRRRALLGFAVAEWEASGHRADYLYTGDRLAEYEEWSRTSLVALTEVERRFLEAAGDERDRGDEEAASQHAQHRKARRRLVAMAAVLVAVIGVGALFTTGGGTAPRVERFSPMVAGGNIAEQLDQGWAQAARELDLEVGEVLEPVSDPLGQFKAIVETAPEVVFIEGSIVDLEGLLRTDFEELSARYPDQLFAAYELIGEASPNLAYVEYASHEGSYLAGVAAATVSQTDVIAFMGGTPSVVDGFRAGFEAGARSVKPDIEILSTHLLGGFFEVFVLGADAPEVTRSVLAAGADVVFHATGEGGAAIRSTIAAEGGAWYIGVDVDESLVAAPEERDVVLTSMLKRHDLAVVEIARRAESGDLEPGPITGDVANGVMDLVLPGNLPPDAVAAVERARDAIVAGDVVVTALPTGPPIVTPGTVATVRVDPAVAGCIGEPLEFRRGDIVRFEIDNARAEHAWLATWALLPGVSVSDITAEGLRVDQAWGFAPITSLVVPPFASGALTVRFDEVGTWVMECGEPFPTGAVDFVEVQVVEATVDSVERVVVTREGDLACLVDFETVPAGVVRLELEGSRPDVTVTVSGVDRPPGDWHPDWFQGTGQRLVGGTFFSPDATEVVALMQRPGWYVITCVSATGEGELVAVEVLP